MYLSWDCACDSICIYINIIFLAVPLCVAYLRPLHYLPDPCHSSDLLCICMSCVWPDHGSLKQIVTNAFSQYFESMYCVDWSSRPFIVHRTRRNEWKIIGTACTCSCLDDGDWHWVLSLTVPMHLDLTDEPFVSHNISAPEGPVPLLKFQMAPRLKISIPSGSKKRTQIYFSFSLKKSHQTNPLQVPQQDHYGEREPFTGHFCVSLETLIKISLNIFFPSLQGPKKRGPPHVPQKRALWKQTPISRPKLILRGPQ